MEATSTHFSKNLNRKNLKKINPTRWIHFREKKKQTKTNVTTKEIAMR